MSFLSYVVRLQRFLKGLPLPEDEEYCELEYLDDLMDFEICDNIHPDHIWDREWDLFT
jgi:hypothetical protein